MHVLTSEIINGSVISIIPKQWGIYDLHFSILKLYDGRGILRQYIMIQNMCVLSKCDIYIILLSQWSI